MRKELLLAAGIGLGTGLGAGLMYLLDPEAGRRRRARLRDQATAAARRAQEALAAAGHDLCNRATGVAAQARALLAPEEVPDQTLAERVRAQLGHCVRHMGSLEVTARAGRVRLRGPILAREAEAARAAAAAVRGVRQVDDCLEVHESADRVPALQGGERPTPPTVLAERWSPSVRLLAGTAGAALAAYGVTRRAPVACILGTAGLALCARGLSNRPLTCLVGIKDCGAVELQKSITLEAPVERVFEFWANYENFPRFMTHVREVRDLGEGRSHWVVAGPGGLSLEWDAVLTGLEPDEMLAWKSEPGALVSHSGTLRFEALGPERTRVHVRTSYQPPAGLLGHLVAALFGSDPKTKMDADLMRMKTLVETGNVPHDAAAEGEVPPLEQWLAHPELMVTVLEEEVMGPRFRLYSGGR